MPSIGLDILIPLGRIPGRLPSIDQSSLSMLRGYAFDRCLTVGCLSGYQRFFGIMAAFLLAGIMPAADAAGFSLNFLPNTSVTDATGNIDGYVYNNGGFQSSCGISGYADTNNGTVNSGCNWSKSYLIDANGAAVKFGTPAQQLPFRQETISVTSGPEAGMWIHVMVGDPTTDFRQDTYIRMSDVLQDPDNGQLYWHSRPNWYPDGVGSLSSSGGLPGAFIYAGRQAASVMDAKVADGCAIYGGNGCDPLGLYNSKGDGTPNGITDHRDSRWTGNGTGNPTRVIMRQVNAGSPDMYQEFLKDRLDKKPLIYQTVTDVAQGMKMTFQADMREKSYFDITPLKVGQTTVAPNTALAPVDKITGTRINGYGYNAASEFVLTQTLSSAAGGNYNIASIPTTAKSKVSAGQYIYYDGSGWTLQDGTWTNTYFEQFYNRTIYGYNTYVPYTSSVWGQVKVYEPGSYVYADGGYDQLKQSYWSFMDPAQNPCKAKPFCP
jgi:hypothetical protein